jgi:hypothetical protein
MTAYFLKGDGTCKNFKELGPGAALNIIINNNVLISKENI